MICSRCSSRDFMKCTLISIDWWPETQKQSITCHCIEEPVQNQSFSIMQIQSSMHILHQLCKLTGAIMQIVRFELHWKAAMDNANNHTNDDLHQNQVRSYQTVINMRMVAIRRIGTHPTRRGIMPQSQCACLHPKQCRPCDLSATSCKANKLKQSPQCTCQDRKRAESGWLSSYTTMPWWLGSDNGHSIHCPFNASLYIDILTTCGSAIYGSAISVANPYSSNCGKDIVLGILNTKMPFQKI